MILKVHLEHNHLKVFLVFAKTKVLDELETKKKGIWHELLNFEALCSILVRVSQKISENFLSPT